MLTRRRFCQLAAAFSATGVATGLYAWQCEPHWVDFVERPLPLSNLPEALSGKRLVQLSDLHIGPCVDDAYLIRAFQEVDRLDPEIVVYTGDFMTFETGCLEHLRRVFEYLPRGRSATLGVLGNHDYGPRWARPHMADSIVELAAAVGVRILRNEAVDVDGLRLVGIDDLWARRLDLGKAIGTWEPQRPSVALVHNPDVADRPEWGAYDGWILCGHTHGGQCKPPFLPAPLLPVKNRRYQAGEYGLTGGRRMYINRGLGHLLQVRFNARPEVTVFSLASAPSPIQNPKSKIQNRLRSLS